MSVGVFLFLLYYLPVHLQLSVHHLDCPLHSFWPVVWEGCNDVISCWVSPSARSLAFALCDEHGNIHFSENWGTDGSRTCDLFLFLCDHQCQGLEQLPLLVHMVGQGVGRRSSIGRGSAKASGSIGRVTHVTTATGHGGGCSLRLLMQWYDQYFINSLENGWWFRSQIGSYQWFQVNCRFVSICKGGWVNWHSLWGQLFVLFISYRASPPLTVFSLSSPPHHVLPVFNTLRHLSTTSSILSSTLHNVTSFILSFPKYSLRSVSSFILGYHPLLPCVFISWYKVSTWYVS